MTELRLPWLEAAVLLPLIGAVWVRFRRDPAVARRHALAFSGAALVISLGAWIDFATLGAGSAHAPWSLLEDAAGRRLFVVDHLNAPLLALGALLYTLTILGTLRTKFREFSLSRTLVSESLLLACLAAATSWGVVIFMALAVVPRLMELVQHRRPCRVYLVHMGLFVALLFLGEWGVSRAATPGEQPLWAVLALAAAVLIRSGVVPLHCWMTDLFERASFGTALLFVTPMNGAFGFARLVAPVAPGWALHLVALVALTTAVYAAGMALVQNDARRFFCYLFLSHSSLVLVGVATATPLGLTGALSLWLSVSLSLTGFGLVLRCVEARVGRVYLAEFLGLYEQIPMMAGLFLLTGLASVGFPGTPGFIGVEMIVEAVMRTIPYLGPLIVVVAALNGLAVIQAYFRIFAGRRKSSSIDLRIRKPERIAVLVTTLLLLGGGLAPQWGVGSRYKAALQLLAQRAPATAESETAPIDHAARPAGAGEGAIAVAPSDAPR